MISNDYIKFNTDDPEIWYLVCQFKEIFNSLPASAMCDADYIISQLRKKVYGLNHMTMQSLDKDAKEMFKEKFDCALEHTRSTINEYLEQAFESIKRTIFRKFEINNFVNDGAEITKH